MIAYGDADITRGAIYDSVGQGPAPWVCEQLIDISLENVVPDAGEVVPDIRFQDPAVGAPVLPVILPHEVTEAVEAEVGSLSDLAPVVIQDKGAAQDGVKDVVAKGVLHDFVLDAVRLDEASLWLKDVELMVISRLVETVPQLSLQDGDRLQSVQLHFGNGVFPSLAFPGCPIRRIEISEVINDFKILFHNRLLAPLVAPKLQWASLSASALCVYPCPVRPGPDTSSFDGGLLLSPFRVTRSRYSTEAGRTPLLPLYALLLLRLPSEFT